MIKIMSYLVNICLKQLLFYKLITLLFGWFLMKIESNRRVNSCTQSIAQNDFPLLSYLSPLPLVSQSNKYHKKPMFLHLLHSGYIFYASFYLRILCLIIFSMFFGDLLIEGSLIGPVHGDIF